MYLFRQIFGKNLLNTVLLEAALISTCLFGDSCLGYVSRRLEHSLLLRGAIDSSTHGLIALWSWALVENSNFNRTKIVNIFVTGLLALCVDLDHFYAARSLSLKDAMSLPQRPPLHLSTIIPIGAGILWLLGNLLQVRYLKTFSLMFFIALFSHHLRDATRRGFWCWPFFNTPAVPYVLYVVVTMLLPFVVRVIYLDGQLTKSVSQLRSEEEVEVVIQ